MILRTRPDIVMGILYSVYCNKCRQLLTDADLNKVVTAHSVKELAMECKAAFWTFDSYGNALCAQCFAKRCQA